VTQEVFRLLGERVEQYKTLWVDGNLMSDNSTALIANNALAQGYCRACKDLINMEAGQLFEKED
jgi:hypothetical protein